MRWPLWKMNPVAILAMSARIPEALFSHNGITDMLREIKLCLPG